MSEPVEPQSIAADNERERKVRVFRVLKWQDVTDDGRVEWEEQRDVLQSVYLPDVQEIGEQYGEGFYLLLEVDDRYYSFQSVYSMRVVEEKRYREARDDEAAA